MNIADLLERVKHWVAIRSDIIGSHLSAHVGVAQNGLIPMSIWYCCVSKLLLECALFSQFGYHSFGWLEDHGAFSLFEFLRKQT